MRAEALLFNAARAQLVDEVIRPALAAGRVVLCDRYADSTLAYQGYGHGQDLNALRGLIRFATGGLQPDLTVYLDIEARLGLERKQPGEWNRMEAHALAFHEAVRSGYLALAAAEPGRWLVVPAVQPPEAIGQMIFARVTALLATAADWPPEGG
jgi:dTMP kinase